MDTDTTFTASPADEIVKGYTKFSVLADRLSGNNVLSPSASKGTPPVGFCRRMLPDKAGVINIVEKLHELIFPEFYGSKSLDCDEILPYTEYLMQGIRYTLIEQIMTVINKSDSESKKNDEIRDENRKKAEQICKRFFDTIPRIQEYISYDIQAAYDGDPAVEDKNEIILSYPGPYAIFIYRFAHELYKLGVSYIPRIMSEYAHEKTGIDIHPGAEIGKYFFIDHGTGIVIGETTSIGDHVKIYQGVTLGALSTKGGQSLKGVKRHPTIEDNVTIYSGASVLGGKTVVGQGAVLGGNVFITKSIPAGAKVYLKNIETEIKYDETNRNGSVGTFTQSFD